MRSNRERCRFRRSQLRVLSLEPATRVILRGTKSQILFLIVLTLACSETQKESDEMRSLSSFWKDRTDLDYRLWMPDKANGKIREYYDNGNLKLTGNFTNRKPIDSLVMYYPNGTVKDLVYFKNGLPEGVQMGYHFNGSLKYYAFYNYGLPAYYKQYGDKGELLDFMMGVAMKSPTVSKKVFKLGDTIDFKVGLGHSMFSRPIFIHYFIANSDTIDSRTSSNLSEQFVLDSLTTGTYQLDFHILEYDGSDSTFQGGTVYRDSIQVTN